MFGEIRSAMNGGSVVTLPEGWREDEALRGYVEAYTQRNEWSLEGDALESDQLVVMCGGLVMTTLSGDAIWRAHQIAVWPVRLHAVETYFKPHCPEDARPRTMLHLRRQRLLGDHIGDTTWDEARIATWDAARAAPHPAARAAARAAAKAAARVAAWDAAWHAANASARVAGMDAAKAAARVAAWDAALKAHNKTVATNIIRLVRGEDPAEIMSWEVTR